jgi:hypothetical protein
VDVSDDGGIAEPTSADEVADSIFGDYWEVNGERKQIC